MNVLISVIVPVYQVERYLKRCLDSLLSQTFENFEMILVDDGSKDISGTICDEYALKDDRIVVVHQSNRGVSAARNAGMREATGKWVYFVDADDWIEPNLFFDFVAVLSEYPEMDIYKFGYFSDRYKTRQEVKDSFVHWVSNPCTMLILNEKNGYFGFLWNMIVRKELLSGLSFDEELKWCEDHLFSFELFLCARKMYISDRCYYHHVQYIGCSLSSAVHDPYKVLRVAEKERVIKYKCIGNCNDRDVKELIETAYRTKIDFAIKNLYISNYSYIERSLFFGQIGRYFNWKVDLKWRIWYSLYFEIEMVYRFLFNCKNT